MHCNLHYIAPFCLLEWCLKGMNDVLVSLSAALVGNLEQSLGMNRPLGLGNFIRHKNAMFKSNQPNLLIRVD